MRQNAELEPGKDAEPPLKLKEKFIAATGASIVSALVVNPLDVLKVRLASFLAQSLKPFLIVCATYHLH